MTKTVGCAAALSGCRRGHLLRSPLPRLYYQPQLIRLIVIMLYLLHGLPLGRAVRDSLVRRDNHAI